uniref:Endonuclease V n=1 Tax=Oryza nivara TaxID=4536 RepID=A0A0E0GWV4_ORYNI
MGQVYPQNHSPIKRSQFTSHAGFFLCCRTQDMLKSKLILEDDFGWNLPSMGSNSDQSNANNKGNLKYIGGVDISFSKEDPSTACAALVVLDAGTLEVVHEEFDVVRLQVPYIPGFLAFREVLMVDGNGLLHPRGFGLACHLGVLADLPTIGVGKNVLILLPLQLLLWKFSHLVVFRPFQVLDGFLMF